MPRGRPRKFTGRGLWRAGGMVGALVYGALVWGALIYGTPRVVAWLGERQAMAAQTPTATPGAASTEAAKQTAAGQEQ